MVRSASTGFGVVALLAFAACGGKSSNPADPEPMGKTDQGGTAHAGMSGAGVSGAVAAGGSLGGAPLGGGGAGVVVAGGGAANEGGNASAGLGAEGGAEPLAGAAGEGASGAAGAPVCDEAACSTSCPAERWRAADGCSTCACAPPTTQLVHLFEPCASAALTLTTTSSRHIGGVDRWLLDFEWKCARVAVGKAVRARLQVRLVQPAPVPIDETYRTFYLDEGQPVKEYELFTAQLGVAGSGVPEINVTVLRTQSFLSIRREGDELVGGVYFVGADTDGYNDATLSGPFRVPVP